MKNRRRGSKELSADNTDISNLTTRKVYVLVDNKHKLAFHKAGHLLIFYSKRDSLRYLTVNDCPKEWRTLKVKLSIIYDRIEN